MDIMATKMATADWNNNPHTKIFTDNQNRKNNNNAENISQ